MIIKSGLVVYFEANKTNKNPVKLNNRINKELKCSKLDDISYMFVTFLKNEILAKTLINKAVNIIRRF